MAPERARETGLTERLAACQAALGSTAFAAHWEAGRAMDPNQAAAAALDGADGMSAFAPG